MNKYEELILEHGIEVDEIDMKVKGLYCDGMIAISTNVATVAEKSCILAEELGHYYTSTGDILDQSKEMNRKQERRARIRGIEIRFPVMNFVEAYELHLHLYEVAEHFDIPEFYLEEVLNYYRQKYGYSTQIGKYMIIFYPLGVMQMFE